MIGKIWSAIRHNQFIIAFAVISGILILWGHSCESQAKSLNGTGVLVTRDELKTELDGFLATAKVRFDSLDKQDAFKKAVLEHAIVYTTTGTLDPLGLVTTIVGLLGIGAVIDNRRKDSVIKTLKNSNPKNDNNVTTPATNKS